jgi:hypothetical protein
MNPARKKMIMGEQWEQDKDDFKELVSGASNEELIGLCEYQLRQAKETDLYEEKEFNMSLAEIAYTEMEKRNII